MAALIALVSAPASNVADLKEKMKAAAEVITKVGVATGKCQSRNPDISGFILARYPSWALTVCYSVSTELTFYRTKPNAHTAYVPFDNIWRPTASWRRLSALLMRTAIFMRVKRTRGCLMARESTNLATAAGRGTQDNS